MTGATMTSAFILVLMIPQGVLIGATTTTMAADDTTPEADVDTTAASGAAGASTTAAAASDPNATTTTEAVPYTVEFTITIAGVDFASLNTNATLKAAFESACITKVADALDGISESNVAVTIREGSVAVDIVITVPSGTSASSVSDGVTAATAGSLGSDLVAALEAIPGLSDIVTGTMSATITAPVVTEASGSTDSDNDVPSSGAWRGAGSVSCAAVMVAAVALW